MLVFTCLHIEYYSDVRVRVHEFTSYEYSYIIYAYSQYLNKSIVLYINMYEYDVCYCILYIY